MECNKEEAVRAKSLAETKMGNKDFAGARKLAIKAQKIYSELDKISHLLIICDVHCAAEQKFSGDMDWYGILQIEKTADETIIKKQYKKFALLLHPDKNNFPGAEEAFKLIGEAQRVLLDKGKRSLHDMKRSVSKPAQAPTYSSNSGAQNGFRGCVGGSNYQHQRPQQPATRPEFGINRQTFWTACPFCHSRYQYYADIINRSVVCQNCHKPFIAHEKSAQGMPTVKKFSQPVFHQRNDVPQGTVKVDVGSRRNASKGHSKVESQKKQGTVKVEVGSQGNASKGHSKVDTEKKPTDGMDAPGKSSRKRRRNKGSDFIVSSDSESSSSDEEPLMAEVGDLESYKERPRRSVRSKQQVSYQENKSDDEESKTPQKKAKGNGSTEEGMQSSVDAVSGVKNKLNTEDFNEDDKTTTAKGKEKINKNGSMRSSEVQNDSDSDTDPVFETESYSFPDPEFNDFNENRDVKLFKAGNIWAAYDDFNAMPRFYARINSVSASGLKLKITWLEADPNPGDEHEWLSAGLPVSCGKFKLGSSTDVEDLNLFSHQAQWEKGNKYNAYEILPRRGEIWALFKNWDINWKSQTNHTNRKEMAYDFVEILSDFSENEGVSVLHLGKLKGFVSLFCRISNKSVQIKSTEMLRFSHLAPSFTMTGEEGDGVPKGSFELDPASVPEKMEEIDLPKNLEGQDDGNFKDMCSEFSKEVEPEVASTHDPQAKLNGTPAESDDPETEQVPGPPAESDDSYTEQVLDPEYFDFDGEKAIEKFENGQIWSVYCDEDCLPKYYALVTKVDKPTTTIRIKWLQSVHLPSGTIKWDDKKMVITCGRFKANSGTDEYDSTGPFSHLVNAESVGRGRTAVYNIVPLEGEIWAMYRDWTHMLTPSELKTCEYDVVQILERNELQIQVSYLERVKGHNAVFRALANQGSFATTVHMSELLRFSHRIPAFQLTEEHGCLNGFWELDSAALPTRYFT
ncbi:Protein HLJ1 [Linum grandiflorum]